MITMNMVFLFGAPRSGTTWAQLLLSRHPEIGTVNETHLFSSYLRSASASWWALQQAERSIGLHHHMSAVEYREILRDTARQILCRLAKQAGAPAIFLEKTPAHVRCWRDIADIFPSARFVRLVRDPRAVVASLCRAGAGWGRRWAHRGVIANASRWRSDVEQGLQAESELSEARCRRLNYEDLWANPVETLRSLFAWLDLPVETKALQVYVQSCRQPQALQQDNPGAGMWDLASEPKGFFGKGGVDGWRRQLSTRQIRVVEYIAGELMDRFDYQCLSQARSVPLAIRVSKCIGLGGVDGQEDSTCALMGIGRARLISG
ncbi:MAG TPA: sulfotransferase [Nitrococcus sp.]|nr:sulfotransferase [Nitrococcus sp.]